MSDPKPDDDVSHPAVTPGSREVRGLDASAKLSALLARPFGAATKSADVRPEPREPPVVRVPATTPIEAEPLAPPADPPVLANPVEAEPFYPPVVPPAPVRSVAAEPSGPPVDPPVLARAVDPIADERGGLDSHQPASGVVPSPAETALDLPPPPPAPAMPVGADAARSLAKVRRLMLVSNIFMFIAIAAVLGVIGYRVFRAEGSVTPASAPPAPEAAPAQVQVAAPTELPLFDMTLTLPRGAKILQSAVAEDLIVITIEIDGAIEIRTFDIKTLKPVGRLTFTSVP